MSQETTPSPAAPVSLLPRSATRTVSSDDVAFALLAEVGARCATTKQQLFVTVLGRLKLMQLRRANDQRQSAPYLSFVRQVVNICLSRPAPDRLSPVQGLTARTYGQTVHVRDWLVGEDASGLLDHSPTSTGITAAVLNGKACPACRVNPTLHTVSATGSATICLDTKLCGWTAAAATATTPVKDIP